MRQRIVWLLPCLLLCLTAKSQVSYWFQGFQRQGNAKLAQEYFFLAGSNIVITYTNPYVYINGTGSGGGSPTGCCPIVSFATNSLFATNALYATNWVYSNTLWLIISTNFQPYCTNLVAWCTNDPALYTNGLGGGGCCFDLRTNSFNGWVGTNYFTNLLGALSSFAINMDPASIVSPGSLFQYHQAANKNIVFNTSPSIVSGISEQAVNDANGYIGLELIGNGMTLNSYGSDIRFINNSGQVANMDTSLNMEVGKNFSAIPAPGSLDVNNWIWASQGTLTNGLIIHSNVWPIVGSMTFGDAYFTSSNGVPYVILEDQAGTITTNLLLTSSTITILDIRTNAFNAWTGASRFASNLWTLRQLAVGMDPSSFTTNDVLFGVQVLGGVNGGAFIVTPRADKPATDIAGVRLRSIGTNISTPNTMEIEGSTIALVTRSTLPIVSFINGTESGRWSANYNLLVGTNSEYIPNANHNGGITSSNSIYTWNYLKGHTGLIITTNSFSRGTNLVVADVFNNGDLMVASSNGIPYAIAKNQTGVCTTNLMLYVAENSTNDWHTAGNSGMAAPGGTFGTLDNSPINIKINNVAAGRLDSLPTIALGVGATASVANDVAIAPTSVANGGGATAVGFNAQATAVGATALGYGAVASGFGATAIGRSSTAQGEFSFANGLNAGQLSLGNFTVMMGNEAGNNATTLFNTSSNAFMLGYNTGAGGNFSYAIGKEAVALNDGSIVFSDSTSAGYSDTKTNQFIVYASGGIDLHSAGAGTKTDGPLEVQTSTFSTNGYYYSASTNGVAPPPVVIQPLHIWASLMMTNTNTFNFGANTYGIITNYSVVRTNLMKASKTAGTATNVQSGYYYCAIHMSAKALDNSAFVEGDVLLNGVPRDEISFQSQFDNPPRYKGMSAFGILYITNNAQITFQIKTSGASGVEVSRAQMVVMPP